MMRSNGTPRLINFGRSWYQMILNLQVHVWDSRHPRLRHTSEVGPGRPIIAVIVSHLEEDASEEGLGWINWGEIHLRPYHDSRI